jgi:hypothetical protein
MNPGFDALQPYPFERLRALLAKLGDELGKVAIGFSSIFWNTAWTRGQPPHTLGIPAWREPILSAHRLLLRIRRR